VRIRQIKPDYWRDSRLHNTRGITADVREFYIGLWGVADDYGYFRWDVPEVASELYRYRTPGRRERDAAEWMRRLVGIGRVRLLDGCDHGFIPKLTAHQKVGGTKSQTYLLEHQKCVPPQSSANSAEAPPTSASNGKGKGTVGNGQESNVSDFEDALARAKARAGESA
jgi:hypothetical protein